MLVLIGKAAECLFVTAVETVTASRQCNSSAPLRTYRTCCRQEVQRRSLSCSRNSAALLNYVVDCTRRLQKVG